MNYIHHFKLNFDVAVKSLHAAIWHLIHAVVPCSFTSHEYWGIDFSR